MIDQQFGNLLFLDFSAIHNLQKNLLYCTINSFRIIVFLILYHLVDRQITFAVLKC